MLDNRSKYILKFIVKECNEGSYKILEICDITANLPKKFNADNNIVVQTLKHLENGGYISVKYSDDDEVCLCPMPFGRQTVENEITSTRTKIESPSLVLVIFLAFLFAFLGAFLGTIICNLIKI